MSCAPVRSRISLARFVHSELSECTERRIPPSLFDAAFVALGLVFGYTHTNQSTCYPTDRPTHTHSRQASHDGAGGDKKPYAGNRQRPDPGEHPERTTDDRSSSGTRRCSFRRLGSFLMGEVFEPAF
jgi:hypothetical protein